LPLRPASLSTSTNPASFRCTFHRMRPPGWLACSVVPSPPFPSPILDFPFLLRSSQPRLSLPSFSLLTVVSLAGARTCYLLGVGLSCVMRFLTTSRLTTCARTCYPVVLSKVLIRDVVLFFGPERTLVPVPVV
jgi:hypothetical protein